MPAHVKETVEAIVQLHTEHYSRATPMQRIVERTISAVGRPRSVGILTIIVLAWMLANLIAIWWGRQPWDAPPFYWLQGSVSLVALYTTILILTTQRRENELAVHREQLTLQLAILGEQKSAKLIQLLEEIRRDSPHLKDRIDEEAADMAMPSDPRSVLDAIRNSV